jgi:hypothetical protein
MYGWRYLPFLSHPIESLYRYRVPFLDVSRWHVLSLFSSYQNFGLDIFFLYDWGSWSASEPARLLFYESKSIFFRKNEIKIKQQQQQQKKKHSFFSVKLH